MIYKILHYLFGWDYVYWKYAYYCVHTGISRIRFDAEGKIYFWRDDEIIHIKNKEDVVWLTCKPEKYLKGRE